MAGSQRGAARRGAVWSPIFRPSCFPTMTERKIAPKFFATSIVLDMRCFGIGFWHRVCVFCPSCKVFVGTVPRLAATSANSPPDSRLRQSCCTSFGSWMFEAPPWSFGRVGSSSQWHFPASPCGVLSNNRQPTESAAILSSFAVQRRTLVHSFCEPVASSTTSWAFCYEQASLALTSRDQAKRDSS
jgi:hypothetical protein